MTEIRYRASAALIAACGLAAVLNTAPLLAADPEPVNLDTAVTLLRTDLRTQRQAIFNGALGMTAEQSTAFWALYKDYDADLASLNDERFQLFKDYANGYASLDDFAAEDIAKRSADLDQRRAALRVKYVKKFARIIPGKMLARFVQIDNRLDLVLNLQIAEQIPLVK